MDIIRRFLGFYDKKQKARTVEVSEYVHKEKHKFTNDMLKIQQQAQKVHKKTVQAQQESIKLNRILADVTSKIAVATGGQ